MYISYKLDNLSNVSLCSCTRAKDVHSVFFFVLSTHNALIMLLLENTIQNYYLRLKASF